MLDLTQFRNQKDRPALHHNPTASLSFIAGPQPTQQSAPRYPAFISHRAKTQAALRRQQLVHARSTAESTRRATPHPDEICCFTWHEEQSVRIRSGVQFSSHIGNGKQAGRQSQRQLSRWLSRAGSSPARSRTTPSRTRPLPSQNTRSERQRTLFPSKGDLERVRAVHAVGIC